MLLRRLFTALLVAVVISAGCTLLLARKLSKPRTTNLKYITAARDLDAGEVLKPADVKLVNWPSNAAIPGALLNPADAIGRAVLSPLASGQPLVAKSLSAVGGVGLAAKIPDGMRAISLKSDQVVGVAGFLLPGTHTDVLVTYRNPSQNDAVTVTVLQNAEVLAAGQKTQPDPDGKPSTVDVVTLLVSPEAAERVVLASTQGTVHFVLRNGADQQQLLPSTTDIAALGLAPRTQPASMPADAPVSRPKLKAAATSAKRQSAAVSRTQSVEYHVVVVRGDKQTVETF